MVAPAIVMLASSLGLSQEELTFGEVAKQAGYKTAIIGMINILLFSEKTSNTINLGKLIKFII